MNERVNPFASLTGAHEFTTKPKRDKPVPEETISQISEQAGFPSREPAKPKMRARKPRLHRTGRNVQFNAKATQATVDRIYKIADERKLMVAEVLELMLEALEREGRKNTETT